jgi:hypothetical protein
MSSDENYKDFHNEDDNVRRQKLYERFQHLYDNQVKMEVRMTCNSGDKVLVEQEISVPSERPIPSAMRQQGVSGPTAPITASRIQTKDARI